MNPLNQTGGRIYIDTSYTEESAFDFFLKNSTLTLLTYTSIGCITITARLDENNVVTSPYYKLRINKWREPIKTILIKLMLYNENSLNVEPYYIPAIRRQPYFEISTKTSFFTEVKNQINIYMSSFTNSPLDPLCPCLLFYKENIDKNIFLSLLTKNEPKMLYGVDFFFKKRNKTIKKTDNVIKTFLDTNVQKSIIVMEFFENCIPLSSFAISEQDLDHDYSNKTEVFNKIKSYIKYYDYAIYTTLELHRLGYYHGDLHHNNILICPEEKYFTVDKPENFGRALIIDFGRTTYDKSIKQTFLTNASCDNLLNVVDHEKFAYNYYYFGLKDISYYIRREFYTQSEVREILCNKFTKLDMYRKKIVYEILKFVGPVHLNENNFHIPFYSSSDENKISTKNTKKLNNNEDEDESEYIQGYEWWGGAVIIQNKDSYTTTMATDKMFNNKNKTQQTLTNIDIKSNQPDFTKNEESMNQFKEDIRNYLENGDFSEDDDSKMKEYLENNNAFMQNEETVKQFKEDINEVIAFNINQIESINEILNTHIGSIRPLRRKSRTSKSRTSKSRTSKSRTSKSRTSKSIKRKTKDT